jgi:Family of unknown function (DUF6510)
MTETWLDGNSLGGPLGELFRLEFTAAVGTCTECGSRGTLAEAPVFARCPGLVVRCPGCSNVLMTLVSSQTRVWMDTRGLSSLEFLRPG